MLDSLSNIKKGFPAHTVCVGLGMGATITAISKDFRVQPASESISLSNNPGCQTTSAELQDSHHNSDSKSGTQTHWAVLQGPEGEGGGWRSQKQWNRWGGCAGQGSRNWTPEMDHSRDTSNYATATSLACHFLPILPPKPLLPHRLSPPPSPTSPSPHFPSFHLLTSHELSLSQSNVLRIDSHFLTMSFVHAFLPPRMPATFCSRIPFPSTKAVCQNLSNANLPIKPSYRFSFPEPSGSFLRCLINSTSTLLSNSLSLTAIHKAPLTTGLRTQ